MWQTPDEMSERTVLWKGYEYRRRDGVLWCTMHGVNAWGDALEQQREAWIGTLVEALFD